MVGLAVPRESPRRRQQISPGGHSETKRGGDGGVDDYDDGVGWGSGRLGNELRSAKQRVGIRGRVGGNSRRTERYGVGFGGGGGGGGGDAALLLQSSVPLMPPPPPRWSLTVSAGRGTVLLPTGRACVRARDDDNESTSWSARRPQVYKSAYRTGGHAQQSATAA